MGQWCRGANTRFGLGIRPMSPRHHHRDDRPCADGLPGCFIASPASTVGDRSRRAQLPRGAGNFSMPRWHSSLSADLPGNRPMRTRSMGWPSRKRGSSSSISGRPRPSKESAYRQVAKTPWKARCVMPHQSSERCRRPTAAGDHCRCDKQRCQRIGHRIGTRQGQRCRARRSGQRVVQECRQDMLMLRGFFVRMAVKQPLCQSGRSL